VATRTIERVSFCLEPDALGASSASEPGASESSRPEAPALPPETEGAIATRVPGTGESGPGDEIPFVDTSPQPTPEVPRKPGYVGGED
jgi:hypothetical protein